MTVSGELRAAHQPFGGVSVTATPHILIIDEDRRYSIECPGVSDSCRLWEEATCAEAQPREEWDGDTWFDWEGGDTAHGVTHALVDGSWRHPLDDCALGVDLMYVADAAADLQLPPGRHAVVHTYDRDGAFELKLATEAASS